MISHELTTENKDRVCDECGSIHKNGISWHGRCYHCGGDLVEWVEGQYELVAVTPKGIKIYELKHLKNKLMTSDQYFNELLEMFTSHIETSDERREEQIKAYILQWLESHPLPSKAQKQRTNTEANEIQKRII